MWKAVKFTGLYRFTERNGKILLPLESRGNIEFRKFNIFTRFSVILPAQVDLFHAFHIILKEADKASCLLLGTVEIT